ncbi:DUF1648 domain-containing protein [Kutzneria sp. CA-103260]|uniref:DUF1648 domain-containing protein n=1 Tax=Kutzneria sp. CA-103260 TaxID=2802641 RepID=UPI001BA5EE15|nr:DUF1648 domain-containing protein [Kutzneria sp. CA-103260]QUQ66259.1 hypothetical protein JJ691_39860 [Kutzneria sp. CA-103260]
MTTTAVVAHLMLTGLLLYLAWLTPSLSARTVRFGVRVPDERVDDPVVRRETTRFRTALLLYGGITGLLGVGLMLAIGLALLPLPVIVVELVWYGLYYRAHQAIAAAKRDQDWFAGVRQAVTADTTLRSDPPKFPWLWLLLPFLVVAATAVIGTVLYPSLPDPLPMHYDANGVVNRWAPKSVGSVFGIVFVQAVLTVLLCGIGALIGRAPADVDPARPAASAQAHREHVVRLSRGFIIFAALMNLGLAAVDWAMWTGTARIGTLLAVALAPILLGVGLLAIIVVQRGREQEPDEHTGLSHRDDDGNWIGGVIYRNANDPSWFVQRRFGFGWTINIGNRTALAVCGGLVVVVLAFSMILPFILR